MRVDLIGRDCELEIFEILLMVDPRDWDVTVRNHCVHVHDDIASSRVWVHDELKSHPFSVHFSD